MKIIPQFNLQNHNTLNLSCIVDFWIEIEHPEELTTLFQDPRFKNLPFHVLGEGSNIILSKEKFHGMVLKLALSQYICFFDNPRIASLGEKDKVHVNVSADYNWHDWVVQSQKYGYGLENLALIPGTVGASLVQNIGAYGVEVAQFIQKCKVFNASTGNIEYLNQKQCQFSYRDSIFKKKHEYIILEVLFVLDASFKTNIKYPDLQKYFNAIQSNDLNLKPQTIDISAEDVLQAIVNIRQQKLPDPKVLANVGSFFKNPILNQIQYQKIYNNTKDHLNLNMPCFELPHQQYKIPAAWLIEQAGFKGFINSKGVGISEKHALVLVNYQSHSGQDVLEFAAEIQAKVKALFLIDLEIEPLIIV